MYILDLTCSTAAWASPHACMIHGVCALLERDRNDDMELIAPPLWQGEHEGIRSTDISSV